MAIGSDFKLKYQIDADNSRFKAAVRESDSMLGRFGQGASSAFSSIAGPAQIAGAGILAIGSAAVSTGVALFNLTKQASDYGSEIFDASKKTGLTAEALSAMRFAADQSGSSMESITGSVAKFAKTVGAANEDTKKAEKFLHDFGFTPQEAINDLDGSLAKVFKKIQDAPAGIARMTLAQKAFGRSGADLLPFLDSFDGDLAGLIKKAKDLGVTIDDDAARAADEFGDTLDTVSTQFAHLGMTIGQSFMPWFREMAEETSDWATRHKDEIRDWSDGFAAAVEAATNKTHDFVTELLEWKAVQQALMVPAFWTKLALGATGLQAEKDRLLNLRRQQATEKEGFKMMFGGGRPTPGRSDPGSYAGGGRSKSDSRSDKQVYQDFVRELRKVGVDITSGFRTYAQQAALYKRLGPGEAARPGTSEHEFYRGLDLPAGVPQELVDKAARQAGVTLDKPLFHQGTGYHRHQGFQKGKYSGSGEADLEKTREEMAKAAAEATDFEREIEAGLRDLAARMIAEEQTASERRLDIRRAEAEIAISIIEDQADRGLMSERQAAEEIGMFKLDMLEEEKAELEKMIPTEERLHQLAMLEIAISKQQIDNERAVNKILNDRVKLYASMAVESDGDALVKSVEDAKAEQRRRQGERSAVTAPGSFGGSLAESLGADLVPMWDAATNAMIGFQDRMAMVQTDINDFVGGAIGGMVEGLAQMAIAWIVTGEGSAKAALQMMAATALSIAVQAGIKAVFEAAESVAAAARWDFVGAAAHATAATMYSSVAVIAGAAGIGLALGARAMGGGKGGGGGRGGGQDERNEPQFGRNLNKDPDPYTRRSENFFMSGRDNHIENLTRAIEGLNNKVDSMTPGDVLVRGAKQKSGFIGETAVKDFRTNNGLAVKGAKSMGIR